MTQGPYWDWLYKNGRQPAPTPAWPPDQQFYPPGRSPLGGIEPYQYPFAQDGMYFMPQALAGDPSGGMSWRNTLRGTPKMPWHYYPMPLEMQGGPTPYQSRPNFRNDYDPTGTSSRSVYEGGPDVDPMGYYGPGNILNRPPGWVDGVPYGWEGGGGYWRSRVGAGSANPSEGILPYAGGSGLPYTGGDSGYYGNLQGVGPGPAPTPTPQTGAGKKLNKPARQMGTPPPPSQPYTSPGWPTPTPTPSAIGAGGDAYADAYGTAPAAAPQYNTTFLPRTGALAPPPLPQGWGQAQTRPASFSPAPVAPSVAPSVAPAASLGGGSLQSWMLPPGAGAQAQAAPAEWSLNDYVYNPDNPYAGVPWEYWGDPSLVAYINAQRSSGGGGGGSNNYAFQNQFQQEQEAARNAQWDKTFQQNADQWNQKLAADQAQNARLAEQWQKEMARNQAVDQWTQAFQQAQQDWNKTDAEARNRLTDQGQNLGAFGRRFGPNVSYM